MQIVIPSDGSVAQWVADRLPDDVAFDAGDLSVGIVNEGRLLAAVV